MAKAAKAKKNSAFMKPVQPSEHLAKIVGVRGYVPNGTISTKYAESRAMTRLWPRCA